MSKEESWALIGYGNIGKEVARQVGQPAVAKVLNLAPQPLCIVRSDGIMQPDGKSPMPVQSLGEFEEVPKVTFVAMPSTDDGREAYDYISGLLSRGGTIVTAEKGAAANHFAELRQQSYNFRNLGITATVGGGTRLMNVAREYCRDPNNVTQIHLALNGTLTAIMSSIAPPEGAGMSLGQAVDQAVRLGYAEPGSESPYDVIRSEAQGDIPKKTAIFFNNVGLANEPMNWRDIKIELSNDQIKQVIEEAKVRRFIVSMYPERFVDEHTGPEEDIIGKFEISRDGWLIVAGFRHTDRNPLFGPLAELTGPGNGVVIGLGPDEKDGVYKLTGPGAGPAPTVNTMLDDHLRMAES